MEKLPSHNIKLVARTARSRVKNVSQMPRSLSSEDVVAAFGGKPLGIKAGSVEAPITLLAIRDILAQRLRSTGGRPSLAGEASRQKVQISTSDWEKIQSIASKVEVKDRKVSPAQVASILIHFALERASLREIGRIAKVSAKSAGQMKTELPRKSA